MGEQKLEWIKHMQVDTPTAKENNKKQKCTTLPETNIAPENGLLGD